MHNHVILLGNVGGAIAVRDVGDTRRARFTLATDRAWRDRDGNRHEATDWHLCTLSGPTLDTFAERVGKGALLFLEGSLRTRTYEKNGERRFVTEVLISNWLLLRPGNGERADAAPAPREPDPSPADLDDPTDLGADPGDDLTTDDLPTPA